MEEVVHPIVSKLYPDGAGPGAGGAAGGEEDSGSDDKDEL